MHKILLLLTLGLNISVYNVATAQLSDNFSDGDFTNNPTWAASNTDWIVNTNNQLQSNNTTANSSFSITTPDTLATSAQWDFYVKLAFNTSSANYVDVFLTAASSDLAGSSNTGYFVRLGGTDDEIALYRKDGATTVKLIDGLNATLNTSNNTVRVRVVRNDANVWTLSRDLTGAGTSYLSEGTVTDATYTTSVYFGIFIKQSTASFFQKHFFDDIEIKAYSPNVTPPAVVSATGISATSADVLFSEELDAASAATVANYSVGNSIGTPASATLDATNPALVHLVFTNTFPANTNLTLTVSNIKDVAGNALASGTAVFGFFVTEPYDIVIDEIFADPTPVIGLPNAEYVEIKNTSGKNINLQGWQLNSLSTSSGLFPAYTLAPDSFLIITGTSSAALFASFGKVIGITSFPALDNAGTILSLISKDGIVIHSVSYNSGWYQNDVKSSGGWSLEMIDTKNPCTGAANWKASTNPTGGTPGAKNSIDGNNPDAIAPALLRATALDSVTLELTFDEPVDITKAAVAANYTISDNIGNPVKATPVSPAYNKVQLALSAPIATGKVYTVTVSNVADCSGNIVQAANTARVGLVSVADSFDVVINEVLFNPAPNSVDYVELYNRSNKIVDLKNLYITNRTSSNAIGTLHQLTAESILLFPGDFYVVSESGNTVKQFYAAKNPDNFVDVTMPSMPDDDGSVVFLNNLGQIVDELHYSSKWHSPLIDNDEGISLERIDYNKPTQDQQNWFSAASTVGFGTPSYKNSQYRADATIQGGITVLPKTFSPDNDGFEDFTTIQYQMSENGNVANITIYDAAGRPVKALAKNATLAQTGSFRWDGLDDKFLKVPVGVYVIYTEIFNLNGKKKAYKNTVVVAARF